MRAVLRSAQMQAAEWGMHKVELWNPSTLVQRLIDEAGVKHIKVDREEESIPSLMWYGEGSTDEIEWVGNEKFAWC